MKKCLMLVISITLAAASVAVSVSKDYNPKPIPKEFSYTYMIEGQIAGKSSTKVTETSDRLIFDTTTGIVFGEYKMDLRSHTEADKKTYEIMEFTYEGAKHGTLIGGEVFNLGDTLSGCTIENGTRYPASRATNNDQVLMLEDYVAAHQVLIARAFFAKNVEMWETEVFMPSTYQINEVIMGKFADAVVESELAEAVVAKLQVQIRGAHQYVSFFDKKRGMPVYLAFPGVNTEAFLDEFYGDMPVSRYRLPTVKE